MKFSKSLILILFCSLIICTNLYSQLKITKLQFHLTNITNHLGDSTLIYFADGATDGFDFKYDNYKPPNLNSVPNIYSRISGTDLSINGLPLLTSDKLIRLGTQSNVNDLGYFYIQADSIKNFNPETSIYLIDSLLGKFRKLNTTVRDTFIYQNSNSIKRFSLCIILNDSGPPTADFTVVSDNILVNDTILITFTGHAPANSVFNWNFDGGKVISGSGSGPYKVTWADSGTKAVTLSLISSCLTTPLKTHLVKVNYFTKAEITPSGFLSLCEAFALNLTCTPSSNKLSYQWYHNSSLINNATNTVYMIQHTALSDSGTYYALVKSADITVTSDSLHLRINPLPHLNLGKDTRRCQWSSPFVLDAGSGFASYNWSDGSSGQFFTVNSYSTGSFSYSVTVTDNLGCSASDTINISIEDCPLVPENHTENILSVFPNPASGFINISLKSSNLHIFNSSNLKAEIYDFLGNLILSDIIKVTNGQNAEFRLRTSNFKVGFYFIKFSSSDYNSLLKLMIKH
jgi:hypothetical protein